MNVEVLMPQIGFTMSEGELVEWRVQDGAHVEAGAELFVLGAEKAMQEIESPATGKLRVHKQPGVYEVGTVLAVIEADS